MATISKTLQGNLHLTAGTGGDTINLSLATQVGTALPNALDNNAVEEVYIICDTTAGALTINLPAISTFNYGWNPKIYICHTAGTNTVTVVAFPGGSGVTADTINGSANFAFASGKLQETNYLKIVDAHLWMKLQAAGV